MGDMMRGGPAPQPGMGGSPQGGGMQAKQSVFNPADMASKVTKGDVRPDQTVEEFLQRNFGVSPQDPVQKLFASLKGQVQNSTGAGKMGMPPTPSPSPGGAAPMGAQRGAPMGASPPPQGMDDLVKRM